MKMRQPAELSDAMGSKSDGPSKPFSRKKRNNLQRLAGRGGGGGGLSLDTFSKMKSTTPNDYNPAIIKKKRELYKNAKCVSKFKKMLKQENYQPRQSSSLTFTEGGSDAGEGSGSSKKNGSQDGGSETFRSNKKNKGKNPYSLKQLYDKQHEEAEKAKMEREVIIKAKQVERARAEAKRKAAKEIMFKKTRYGQPVMKYRIEHLLQTIQGSNGNSA